MYCDHLIKEVILNTRMHMTVYSIDPIFFQSSTMNIVEDEQLITSTKFDKWKEYIFVSCICVIIFSCFCTPIIIYATSGDVTSLTELGIDEIDLDNCTEQV